MRKRDLNMVWAASPEEVVEHGAIRRHFERLRHFRANVQQMDDATQQKLYGRVGERALVLRASELPDIDRDDTVYFTRPEAGEDGKYGPGPYRVVSVRPRYVGIRAKRNFTEITVREVEDDQHSD